MMNFKHFVSFAILLFIFSPFTNAVESPNGNRPIVKESETDSVSSVNSVPREKVEAISQKIDQLVQSNLKKHNQKLNPLSSDEIFLRRAYLDIVGRIPSIEETKSFLASSETNKREELIDELLDSYGYVSRQFNFWADLLRVKTRLPGQLSGIPYADYIKDSLESNTPYDEFVKEMVGSVGPNLKQGNGAVGYYLRDRNMPEDNMSNTVRIFLGTRLECAQCHDHPFDKWTQRQYFEMVAFTGGMRYRAVETQSTVRDIKTIQRDKSLPEKLRPIANRLAQTVGHGVAGSGTGLARLPEGFLGDDGVEGEIVAAKEMFSGEPLQDVKIPQAKSRKKMGRKNPNVQQASIPGASPIDSRTVYAEWLVDRENPRFAAVIANRLWKQSMGVGLVEPVDIIEDDTVASNPELLEFLEKTMLELNFDLKQFLRVIYNTETYQATAYGKDINDPQEFYFNGPLVRRMSAEQLWDSLLVLTVPDTDTRFRMNDNYGRFASLGSSPYEAYEKLTSMNSAQLRKTMEQVAAPNAKKKQAYKDDPGYIKMNQKRRQLGKQLQQARKQKNVKKERDLLSQQAELMMQFRKTGRAAAQFQRASELTSPANAGHFLREFGQSDRDAIENSNTDPAVTQVLSMMNGYIEERIAKDNNTVLMQTAIQSESAKECTQNMYLSMLNRKPTSTEAKSWERDFKDAVKGKDKVKIKETYTDLIWTLANSNEFIFVK